MAIYEPSHLIIKSDCQQRGNLWLGDYQSARNKRNLRNRQIMSVITAGLGMKISYSSKQIANHKVLALYDCQSENIERYFDDTFEFLQKTLQQGNVLVHCFAGISRSSTIVISYLMRKQSMSYRDAFHFVKKKRPYINPNKGFVKQLRILQANMSLKIGSEKITTYAKVEKQRQQREFQYQPTKSTTFYGRLNKNSQNIVKNDRKISNRGISYNKSIGIGQGKSIFGKNAQDKSDFNKSTYVRPYSNSQFKNSQNVKQQLTRSVFYK